MKKWIEDELEKVEKTYLIKATNMTGPYHREKALTKEYDGRQLLELLQNADDEAENTENHAVLIKLEENQLVVANNGKPFSKSGVRSLIDSDNSPKIMRRRKIGYKGLGFRAVLNWSDSIWIKSGGFSIEFSRSNAVAFFKKLFEKRPSLGIEMHEHFGEEYRYDKECPVATLAAPSWKESWDLDTSQYDTYVVINFSDDVVREDIQRQINGLGMEVALFLNNLRRIVLDSPERRQTIERVQSSTDEFDEIRILDEHSEVLESKKWRIFSKSDELPEEVRDEREAEQYEYDLRIAVSENLDDNVNRLFSYFRTEVKFPFPAIVHGTFELDDTRNHLVKSPTNTFLLKELASLMIDTAKKITRAEEKVSWDAMRLLAKRGEFDDKVEEMGFYKHLLDAIKSEKLIPVLSNKYMSVDEGPVFYDVPFAEALRSASDVFPDLAIYIEDEEVKSLIIKLNIGRYEKAHFVKKIDEASARLSIDKRADLILLIADKYLSYFHGIEPKDMPSLFIDEQGREISSRSQALLPPERAKFRLPENIKINFISEDLFRRLRQNADLKRARDLASRLKRFNVDEYRFDTVIRRIVAVTNRLVRENDTKAGEYVKNMLSALFQIYHDDPEAAKQFPSNVNVRVFSRSGTLRSTRELYFGKEYSVGRITEALYSRIDDTVFLPERQQLGLEEKTEPEVIQFLKWIGVEEYPRIVQKTFSVKEFPSEYEKYVLRNLPYPYSTDRGENYGSFEKLKSDKAYYRSDITTAYINELEDILLQANFEDILAWLHSDRRVKQMIENGHEPEDSSFGIWLKHKQTTRDIKPKYISSFILWKLRTSEWVKTRSGRKVTPDVCCLSRTVLDMSPLVEVPAYGMGQETLKEHNVKQEDIDYILEKVGVARNFEKLSDETIYAILANLESADPEGKKAENVYRQIIRSRPREWARDIRGSDARNTFVEKGKLLARHDGRVEYMPVKDVYYVDNITFCRQIIDRFPIAKIPRRSGKDQVSNIFGVTALEDISFSLTGSPKVHPLNAAFARAFEGFKPYVLVFRLEKPTYRVESNRLKRLKVVLCTSIPARYEFGDTKEDLVLHPYEHIYIPEENTAYLLLQAGKHTDIPALKNEIRFCEAFSEILTGILKVGENRKDYRDLFPKDKSQRDMIIQNDLDDPELEKLKKAKELFIGLSDLVLDFWETVLRTKGKDDILTQDEEKAHIVDTISRELEIKHALVKEAYESIYYEDYNSSTNLPFFKKLFEALNISVRDFNRHSFREIDFTECLNKEFENEKYRLKTRFKSYVFTFLLDKNIKEKERFVEILEIFDITSVKDLFDINKDLVLDVQRCFDILFKKDLFGDFNIEYATLLKKQDSNPDDEFAKNKKAFERKIEETGSGYADDIESFLNAQENRSLVYFGEISELIERFNKKYSRPPKGKRGSGGGIAKKKKSISLNGYDVEFEEDDYATLAKNVDDDLRSSNYEIESHSPSRREEKAGEPPKLHGVGSGRGVTKKYAKEIGFLGEKYVYETLVRKHTKEKVVWASQYAKMVNVNPEGRDDIGHDISYADEEGKKHYVEVKATKNEEKAFSISKAEVRFGQKHKSDYDVILVLNVCDKNRRLLNLGKIFEFEEDATFNNNNKFCVDTETFRISFD